MPKPYKQLILIPVDPNFSLNAFTKLQQVKSETQGKAAIFYQTLHKNTAMLIMSMLDLVTKQEYNRCVVAEIRTDSDENLSHMGFNPRRVPTIVDTLISAFICQWSGNVPMIEYFELIGSDYAPDDEEGSTLNLVADDPLYEVFVGMGFDVSILAEEGTTDEPTADENASNSIEFTSNGQTTIVPPQNAPTDLLEPLEPPKPDLIKRMREANDKNREYEERLQNPSAFTDFINSGDWKHE